MADVTSKPFDDIRDLARGVPPVGGQPVPMRVVPGESLGRLEALAAWVGAVQGKAEPVADRSLVCLFAASHGLAAEPADIEATRGKLLAFSAGTAPINAVCAAGALGFKAFDLALDMPTADMTAGPAMDERATVATMAFGMEAVAGGADVLALGCVGEGSDLVAGLVLAALWGDPVTRWIDPLAPGASAAVVGLRLPSEPGDALEVLARFGGRDVAAVAGAILAARHQRVPVVLDGFAACAAAALVGALDPAGLDGCVAAHAPPHPAGADLLARLGFQPLLVGLGIEAPGVGAALGLGLVKAAVAAARATGAPPAA